MSSNTGQSAAAACQQVNNTANSIVDGFSPAGIIGAIGKLFGANNVTQETAKSIVDNSSVSANVANISTSCTASITSDQQNIIDTSTCPACVQEIDGKMQNICVVTNNTQSNVSDQQLSCQLQSVANLVSTLNAGFQQSLLLKLAQKANGLASNNQYTTDTCTYINNSTTSQDYYDASQKCAVSSFSTQLNTIKGCGFFASNVQTNSYKSYAECMQKSNISSDVTKDVVVDNNQNTDNSQDASGFDLAGVIKSIASSPVIIIVAILAVIAVFIFAFFRVFTGGNKTVVNSPYPPPSAFTPSAPPLSPT